MNTKVCENSGTKNYVPEFVPESYRDVPDSVVNKTQKIRKHRHYNDVSGLITLL
ncbi:hypothetical protein YMSE1_27620 [Lactiplantibacillus plantarum]